MNKILVRLILMTPFFYKIRNYIVSKGWFENIENWEKKGRPAPPPHIIKQKTLLSYKEKYELKIFVETGTYFGDMLATMIDEFDQIYSIELSKDLYLKALDRFKSNKNINLLQGDSGIELKNIMALISQPALFWLDSHYSSGVTARGHKDTPIIEELQTIFGTQDFGHVIIIDDSRCFGTNPSYPSIEKLCEFIKSKRSNVEITIQNDSIRITPTP